MKEIREVIGDNIRNIRKREGLTQTELAELLDVTVSTISAWESGQKRFDETDIFSISMTLGTDPSNLMNFKNRVNQIIEISQKNGISIRTHEGDIKNGTNFFKQKIQSPVKKRPSYQLYMSNGFTILGFNRCIIGFYNSEDSIDKEISEIFQAMKESKATYELKYYSKVRYDITGLPVLINSEKNSF